MVARSKSEIRNPKSEFGPYKNPVLTSRLSAWLFLVGFSLRRQLRARQMAFVALSLLGLLTLVVYARTKMTGWDRTQSRLEQFHPDNIALLTSSAVQPAIDDS